MKYSIIEWDFSQSKKMIMEEFYMNELKITEYKNIRVLTTQQIAEAYGTEDRRISENFNSNKGRYIEGKHYIKLEKQELKEFLQSVNSVVQNPSKIRTLYLWTEKGAFLHAKSLNTDRAWEIYDKLVDSYFNKKEDLLQGLSKELQAIIVVDKRITEVESRMEKLENNMTITHEQMQVIKKRINKKITDILGGYESNAYKDRHIRAKTYSRLNKDYCDYFRINARANTLTAEYDEALKYIDLWQPDTNMKIKIQDCNSQISLVVDNTKAVI